jgi:alanine dehydrogenase
LREWNGLCAEEEAVVIGVPKEIKDHEYRVSVTPDGVRALHQAGHDVWIEPSAGVGSGYSDEDYRSGGATMAESKAQLFSRRRSL